jgi:hypothetical protein
MSATYQIMAEQEDIVIRFPRCLVDEGELMRFLDYMDMESIRRQSAMSGNDANALAESVKQGAWQQVKSLFVD